MTIDIPEGTWCLYLLECRGRVMYAGITNRLSARFAAHVAGKGARFTRANPPIRILCARPFVGRSEASKAEWAIKQLPRAKKLAFLSALGTCVVAAA
ncbi:GIY-YIG nuclease family protein [Variovorax gossypii]|uniref:GIY-YIG nuclease family protein n=1 Tax=uncultured Variovorax sp. TaxID=114708 RepID=UPI0026036214|nr:GIY-YIG nuclease family protein [uncultured Variovorax sp.]